MARYLVAIISGLLTIGLGWPTYGQSQLRVAQLQNSPSSGLAGTWRSGNFAFTFSADGRYVYVGAMGGAGMQTRISEEGTYSVSGNTLIIQRQSGLIQNTANYRQDLGPQVTTYGFVLGTTQFGLAMQLTFPDGRPQTFYRE